MSVLSGYHRSLFPRVIDLSDDAPAPAKFYDDDILIKAYERYSYAYVDPRGCWPVPGPKQKPVLANMLPPIPWIMRGKNMERVFATIILTGFVMLWVSNVLTK